MVRPLLLATLVAALVPTWGCGGSDDGGDELEALPAAFRVDLGMGVGQCGDMSAIAFTGATSAEPRFTFVENPVGTPGNIFVCQAADENAAGWSLVCESADGMIGTLDVTRGREGSFTLRASATIQCDWIVVSVSEQ
jgi:hypothetical protein